jgi:7-carboxy-7-deazaguanine synthase
VKTVTDSPKLYPIHEMFNTWQGEGVHMGEAAFFIRTFGCPVHCAWCDSSGTWHKDYIPTHISRLSGESLASEAANARATKVVITGGEPAIHDLTELTAALHNRGINAHLETSGAFPIQGSFDWVTVSPKWAAMPLSENLLLANEWKLIIENTESIDDWWAELRQIYVFRVNNGRPPTIWLHPEWSQRSNYELLSQISEAVKEVPGRFRAGYQLHKVYDVDTLDNRSAPKAPLGGDVTKGY